MTCKTNTHPDTRIQSRADFSIDWPHGHTWRGRPAKILMTDRTGHYPVAARVVYENGEIDIRCFGIDGIAHADGFLVNVPAPPPPPVKKWFRRERGSVPHKYLDFDSATQAASTPYCDGPVIGPVDVPVDAPAAPKMEEQYRYFVVERSGNYISGTVEYDDLALAMADNTVLYSGGEIWKAQRVAGS